MIKMAACLLKLRLLARLNLNHANGISCRFQRGLFAPINGRQSMKTIPLNSACVYPGAKIKFQRNSLFIVRRGYCSSGVCWNCNAELSRSTTASGGSRVAALFCVSCGMIQPLEVGLNHFQIMGMKEEFDMNLSDLTNGFRNLQRLLHPDKFSNKSEIEQNYSAEQSSAVNRAYKVLLKPLSRGLYMLELRGFSIEEGESNIDPAFLMEVMEVNEELADTDDIDTIRRIGKDNAVILDAHLGELKEAFSKGDYPGAREILMRLKYYANIDDKVKEKLGTN